MPSVNFPDNPTLNQTFTVGDRTWKWTGTTWDALVTNVVAGPQGPTGEPGEGVASGGTTGQILVKNSSLDYDTRWANNQVLSYTHVQNAVSYIWEITHNLGYKPSVIVTDSAGTVVEADVSYTSQNQVTISLSQALSGYAYLT